MVFGVDGGRRRRDINFILASGRFLEVTQCFSHGIAECGEATCSEHEEHYEENENNFAET